ncbi:MAG: hypothetical protein ABIP97_13835 [Chthoniobacterales bacterium]
MKTIIRNALLITLLSIEGGFALTPAERHASAVRIQELAHELQDQLTTAQNQVAETQAQVSAANVQIKYLNNWGIAQSDRADAADILAAAEKARADKEQAARIQAGRERDVFVILFALAGAIATVFALVPAIHKLLNLQFPWTAILPVGLFITSFALYFGIVRSALHFFVKAI